MVNLPDERLYCHRTAFRKKCRALVTGGHCNRWMVIQGTDHLNQEVNRGDCVDNWIPHLLLENSKMQRQTGASCDKVATEVAKFSDRMAEMNEHTLLELASARDESVKRIS